MTEIVAFDDANRQDYITPREGGYPAPIPVDELEFRDNSLLPIAETTTLPLDYFQEATLDERYPKDSSRLNAMRRALTMPELALDDADRELLMGAFCLSNLESKPIELAFEEALGDVATQAALPQFVGEQLKVRPLYELRELWIDIFRLPKPLRPLVFEDPDSAMNVLRLFSQIPGTASIVDVDPVVSYFKAEKLRGLKGQTRSEAVNNHFGVIRNVIKAQSDHEAGQIAAGGEDALELQGQRFDRIRYVTDSLDSRLFRLHTNSDTIVDPSYLFDDDIYQVFKNEPHTVSDAAKIGFLKHMIAGEWVFGHDHTYLYRNTNPAIANQRIGIVPDYAVTRSGNYLFHDLRMLEASNYGNDFPLDALRDYVLKHYLEQKDMHVLDGSEPDDTLAFDFNGKSYEIPLQHKPDHVIPYRALKKNLASAEYFEYGEDCYLAELVDIALQLDRIEELRGNKNVALHIGDAHFGRHTRETLEAVIEADRRLGTDKSLTVVKQLAFMEAYHLTDFTDTLGSHLTTLLHEMPEAFTESLALLATTPELDDDGMPIRPRRPMSCYYEWFKYHAPAVSAEEITRRGLLVRPAAYSDMADAQLFS